jgi:hypothetical protein
LREKCDIKKYPNKTDKADQLHQMPAEGKRHENERIEAIETSDEEDSIQVIENEVEMKAFLPKENKKLQNIPKNPMTV